MFLIELPRVTRYRGSVEKIEEREGDREKEKEVCL